MANDQMFYHCAMQPTRLCVHYEPVMCPTNILRTGIRYSTGDITFSLMNITSVLLSNQCYEYTALVYLHSEGFCQTKQSRRTECSLSKFSCQQCSKHKSDLHHMAIACSFSLLI